jgi:hypothetical protein
VKADRDAIASIAWLQRAAIARILRGFAVSDCVFIPMIVQMAFCRS